MEPISIEGALNFRSVRAYRTSGGRLKPHTLFRSGEFSGIGTAGLDGMRRIGVTTVFDLRSDTEKSRRPSPLLGLPDFRVLAESHDFRTGDLRSVLLDTRSTPQACADMMRGVYRALPAQFAPIFRRYFHAIIEAEAPIAIHCAAGKDRTGAGIALLLDLLGVPRDDIVEDYLETNRARDQLWARFRDRNSMLGDKAVPEHLMDPIITADPSYLDAMFAAVADGFGETRTYAKNVLGLTEDEIEALKQRLTS